MGLIVLDQQQLTIDTSNGGLNYDMYDYQPAACQIFKAGKTGKFYSVKLKYAKIYLESNYTGKYLNIYLTNVSAGSPTLSFTDGSWPNLTESGTYISKKSFLISDLPGAYVENGGHLASSYQEYEFIINDGNLVEGNTYAIVMSATDDGSKLSFPGTYTDTYADGDWQYNQVFGDPGWEGYDSPNPADLYFKIYTEVSMDRNTKIRGSQILDLTITSDDLAAGSVTAAKLNADVVLVDGGLQQEVDGSLSIDYADASTQLAGDGLTSGGSAIDINYDDSTITVDGGQLQVKLLGITDAHISESAAIVYSKLSIADGDLTIDKTSGLQTALDGKVNDTGDTMTGNLNFSGTHLPTNLIAPTDPTDATNKAYVDGLVEGISWLAPALVYNMISDADMSGAPPVSPNAGEAYVVNNWGSGYVNGHIMQYNGTIWVDLGALTTGQRFVVTDGTPAGSFATKDNQIAVRGASSYTFVVPTDGDAILITDGYYDAQAYTYNGTAWVLFVTADQIQAGTGLSRSGNVLNINLGAGIKALPSDEVGIDLATSSGLELTSELTGGQLQIAANGVTEARLNIFNSPSVGKFLGYTSNGMEWSDTPASPIAEADFVNYEQANETPNDVLTEFTHDSAAIANSVNVYLNGILQQPGSGKDYTYDSGTKKATFVIAPNTGDLVAFSYVKA